MRYIGIKFFFYINEICLGIKLLLFLKEIKIFLKKIIYFDNNSYSVFLLGVYYRISILLILFI